MDEKKFTRLRERLLESLDGYREVRDEEIYRSIDNLILEMGAEVYIRLSERSELRTELFNSLLMLDILQELIDY